MIIFIFYQNKHFIFQSSVVIFSLSACWCFSSVTLIVGSMVKYRVWNIRDTKYITEWRVTEVWYVVLSCCFQTGQGQGGDTKPRQCALMCTASLVQSSCTQVQIQVSFHFPVCFFLTCKIKRCPSHMGKQKYNQASTYVVKHYFK